MVEVAAEPTHSEPAAQGGKLLPLSLTGLSLATVNRALSVLALIVLVYFVATLLLGMFKLFGVGHHIRSLEVKGSKIAAEAPDSSKTLESKPVDPALGNRNIFQPAGVPVSTTASSGAARTNAYRLVGISASSDPAETYVMVENPQTKLTYFLQYGQPVEGLELEKILEDKVIVKIGGKAVELE